MHTNSIDEETSEIQSNMSTPKYKVIDINSVINGKCSATDSNIAINGVVARVVVDRCNFDDLLGKKVKSHPEERITRGTKRKLQEIKLEDPQSDKKRRGTSKQLKQAGFEDGETSSESDSESLQINTRGRSNRLSEKIKHGTQLKQISVEKRQFNGKSSSSTAAHVSTSRVRKPNSRLQDFVVSSAVRSYAPSSPSTNKPVKEIPILPKEKPLKKISKNIPEDPLNIANNKKEEEEELNKSISSNENLSTITLSSEETVRSFLPVFDDSHQSDESDIVEEVPNTPKKLIKEKENQVNNLQVKLSKNSSSKLIKSHQTDYSPPKLRSGNENKTKIAIPKLQKNKSLESQTKVSQTSNSDNTVTKQKRLNLGEDEKLLVKKPKLDTGNIEGKMNGSNGGIKSSMKYVLVENDGAGNRNKSPKAGDIDFNKLVRSLKLVKLPAANWKIRIVVSKQQTITEVTFTNKEENERCIKFSRTITGFVITFGKSVVNLLGAPTKVSSFNDVSILLDIVHHISPNDPVLEYSTSSNA